MTASDLEKKFCRCFRRFPICHNPTQLNPKLGRPYFPYKPQPQPQTTNHKPSVTFSQLLDNQTQPNSGCNLGSTQLEDSCQKNWSELEEQEQHVCKPNLVKCFGPKLRLWTWTVDFVPGPSFSIRSPHGVSASVSVNKILNSILVRTNTQMSVPTPISMYQMSVTIYTHMTCHQTECLVIRQRYFRWDKQNTSDVMGALASQAFGLLLVLLIQD